MTGLFENVDAGIRALLLLCMLLITYTSAVVSLVTMIDYLYYIYLGGSRHKCSSFRKIMDSVLQITIFSYTLIYFEDGLLIKNKSYNICYECLL